MPVSFGVGFSVITKKIIFGADFTSENWGDASFFGTNFDYLTNGYSIAAGMEFTNDYMSKKYFNTVNLLLGFKYSKSNCS